LPPSFIYRNSRIYEIVMRLLYGRYYEDRYIALANLIPAGSSVLDLCCGPGVLYTRYLRGKSVRYVGLDVNERFIEALTSQGGAGIVMDLRDDNPLPKADYIVMQASLYHFIPRASQMVARMLKSANRQAIIAEPIQNLTSSSNPLLALAGRFFTNPGSGDQPHRFTESDLDQLISGLGTDCAQSFLIPGGREKIYVLNASSKKSSK
jgi:SAM-dependent methyltransferase